MSYSHFLYIEIEKQKAKGSRWNGINLSAQFHFINGRIIKKGV